MTPPWYASFASWRSGLSTARSKCSAPPPPSSIATRASVPRRNTHSGNRERRFFVIEHGRPFKSVSIGYARLRAFQISSHGHCRDHSSTTNGYSVVASERRTHFDQILDFELRARQEANP